MKKVKEPAEKRLGQKTGSRSALAHPASLSQAEMASTDSYDITRQIGHLLRKAYQSHMAIFQALTNNPNITSTQFAVMCVLKENGPSSLTAIGRRIVMDLATVRGIIERLSKRGLISFSRDPTDRRQVIAAIEPAGEKIVASMIPAAQQISEATVKNLSVAERVALQYLLEKISNTSVTTTASEEADAA